MADNTDEVMRRNNQTLNTLVSFPPEHLDGIMRAISQDRDLQGIELRPEYDSSEPRPSYDVFEKGTEIAKIVKLNKRYTCILASQGKTAERLRSTISGYQQ